MAQEALGSVRLYSECKSSFSFLFLTVTHGGHESSGVAARPLPTKPSHQANNCHFLLAKPPRQPKSKLLDFSSLRTLCPRLPKLRAREMAQWKTLSRHGSGSQHSASGSSQLPNSSSAGSKPLTPEGTCMFPHPYRDTEFKIIKIFPLKKRLSNSYPNDPQIPKK